MDKPKQSLGRSFNSAWKGWRHVLTERNFVIQILVGLAAVFLSIMLDLSREDKMIVLLLCAFVLSAEAMNSACERILDLVVKEHHPEVARIKETLAGAVLIYSLVAAVIGIWIFWQAFQR